LPAADLRPLAIDPRPCQVLPVCSAPPPGTTRWPPTATTNVPTT